MLELVPHRQVPHRLVHFSSQSVVLDVDNHLEKLRLVDLACRCGDILWKTLGFISKLLQLLGDANTQGKERQLRNCTQRWRFPVQPLSVFFACVAAFSKYFSIVHSRHMVSCTVTMEIFG